MRGIIEWLKERYWQIKLWLWRKFGTTGANMIIEGTPGTSIPKGTKVQGVNSGTSGRIYQTLRDSRIKKNGRARVKVRAI